MQRADGTLEVQRVAFILPHRDPEPASAYRRVDNASAYTSEGFRLCLVLLVRIHAT